jgi:signal peptidase
MSDESGPRGPVEWLRWLWTTDHSGVAYVREVFTSVGAVLAVGLLLFAVSGVWPPMVAVESGSMEPNMTVGELVFVMDEDRLSPEAAQSETGVVTYQRGQTAGYQEFSNYGDVIIYRPDNRSGTPVIHRARLWVADGENWYDRADKDSIGDAKNCEQLRNCPAPHAGFITKGDNPATNDRYDQVTGLSSPVRPAWIIGTAEFGVPGLGYVKLCASGNGPCPLYVWSGPATPGELSAATGPAAPATANSARAAV